MTPIDNNQTLNMSLQTSNLTRIVEIPLSHIRRPIAPVLDYSKIDAMVSTMEGKPMPSATCSLEQAEDFKGQLPPVDVLCIREKGQTYYFAFGGCHRFQAYDRKAASEQRDVPVRAKLVPATRHQLKLYVGSSVDDMFN